MTTRARWLLVTSEYPPQPGGVADYTRQLAHALAAEGDAVEVFVPDLAAGASDSPVRLHGLPDRFGRGSLRAIRVRLRELRATGEPTPVLCLQWVPQGYGLRGLNVPFALGFARLPARRWVMFHEVAIGFDRRRSPVWNAAAAGQHLMACAIGRAAERRWVSIPRWADSLRVAGVNGPVSWLPVPTNLPVVPPPPPKSGAVCRAWVGPTVTHFGTYAPHLATGLGDILHRVLTAEATAGAVLVGRNSERFAAALTARHPELAGRVVGRGPLPAGEAAGELSLADLAVYPYPDGVNSRHGSLMALLALGVPVVTTAGYWTEPVWAESRGVDLLPSASPTCVAERVVALLRSPSTRAALGLRGRALYDARFALRHTVAALRAAAGPKPTEPT